MTLLSHKDLDQLIDSYVNIEGYHMDIHRLRDCLQSTPLQQIYDLLRSVRNRYGCTAIHLAVWRDHPGTLKCLLEFLSQQVKYDLMKLPNEWGSTALHIPAMFGNTGLMRCMLDSVHPAIQKKLLDIHNGHNETALTNALQYDHLETATCIRRYMSAAEIACREVQGQRQHKLDIVAEDTDWMRRFERLEGTVIAQQDQMCTLKDKLDIQDQQLILLTIESYEQANLLQRQNQQITQLTTKLDEQKKSIQRRDKEMAELRDEFTAASMVIKMLTEDQTATRDDTISFKEKLRQLEHDVDYAKLRPVGGHEEQPSEDCDDEEAGELQRDYSSAR